jgi:transcriptional regulator with XRE-family HTH domain
LFPLLNLNLIGIRLKAIRGSITQKRLAEEFGVKRSYIANIETGRTQPSLEYLLFNAKKFNVSIDWILRGNEIFDNKELMTGQLEEEPVLREMIVYLRLIWNQNDKGLQSWLKIQFGKCFPDYHKELQKNQPALEKSAIKKET